MSTPTTRQFFVQRPVDRAHLYSVAAVSAHFFNKADARDLDDKKGTAFVVLGTTERYFVTNRHVVDYNYNREDGVCWSAALGSLEIRGHIQPEDGSKPTVPWTYIHETPQIFFHPDDSTDLAIIRIPIETEPPPNASFKAPVADCQVEWIPGNFRPSWLASRSEIEMLVPGDAIYIAGYPGVGGVMSERPLLVSGIISSDPRYPAMFGKTRLENAVLCHSFSWGGMSGAPVFGFSESIGKSRIVGINAGHIASQGPSGGVISHFVRSSALIELFEHAFRESGADWPVVPITTDTAPT